MIFFFIFFYFRFCDRKQPNQLANKQTNKNCSPMSNYLFIVFHSHRQIESNVVMVTTIFFSRSLYPTSANIKCEWMNPVVYRRTQFHLFLSSYFFLFGFVSNFNFNLHKFRLSFCRRVERVAYCLTSASAERFEKREEIPREREEKRNE